MSSSGRPATALDDVINVSSKRSVLDSHELVNAALAVDNDTIINSPISAMPAVTVELPSIVKPPDDIFEDVCCPRILDGTLHSKNISKMVFGTFVVGV